MVIGKLEAMACLFGHGTVCTQSWVTCLGAEPPTMTGVAHEITVITMIMAGLGIVHPRS